MIQSPALKNWAEGMARVRSTRPDGQLVKSPSERSKVSSQGVFTSASRAGPLVLVGAVMGSDTAQSAPPNRLAMKVKGRAIKMSVVAMAKLCA